MPIKINRRAGAAGIFLLALLTAGSARSASTSDDMSTGMTIGALSVAVVPVAVVVSGPAVLTAGVAGGVSMGLAHAGEAIADDLGRQDFDRPLPITDETLMVGPSPADAMRGGVR